MASIDDDQLNKNSFLFIYVRQNGSVEDRLENIKRCLREGADINTADGNDDNNTPTHVAVRKNEADIVRFLIESGADLNLTNSKRETPLAIAQKLTADNKRDILNLLQIHNNSTYKGLTTHLHKNHSSNNAVTKITTTKSKKQKVYNYLKRTGTSGVCGQLYETKLLSLVLMRALNDDNIDIFYLGTNISGIGDLDDICLRYQLKDSPKPVMVFVQAKHREDREKGRLTVEDVRSASGDFSLRKYFESYLTIKERFQPKNKDIMFDGEFSDVECNLIIYTPAKDCFTKKKTDTQISKTVHKLINTGQNTEVFQYDYNEDDINLLTKMTVLERIKKLGSVFLGFIMAEGDKTEIMRTAELISRYHVVMGREVLQLSRIQEENKTHRMWTFRSDFFTSDNEYLVALRNALYRELTTTRCDKSKIVAKDYENFKFILADPCASNISKLIAKLATYDEKHKKLQLIDVKDFKKTFAPGEFEALRNIFNSIEVGPHVIREAIQIKLLSIEFKLPLAFGNLDMTITKSNRYKFVADKLINLFHLNLYCNILVQNVNHTEHTLSSNYTTIVEINDAVVGPGKMLEKGVIDISGGIGSAVGNLLVLDTKTKMLKFDVENKELPEKAALLLDELKSDRYKPVNKELSNYRIKININGFPKDSFEGDEYDKRQARDFLGKLWFYANQAKEDEVEVILKQDINKECNNEKERNPLKFRSYSDAIFLISHDNIQKWWLQTGEAPYLDRTNKFFEQAKLAVINDQLLTILNLMYSLKIKNIGIKFNQDAIRGLELSKTSKRVINVITESIIFSSIKILQHFKEQDKYTFVDFDYVLSLPLNDYNTMLSELKQTKIETLIVSYEKLKYYEGFCNKLKEVINIFKGSKVVVVTDVTLGIEIKRYVGDQYQSVRDDKAYLIDLDDSSQSKILDKATIVFQGKELPLKSVSYQNSRSLVRTEILIKLIYGEKIEIGHTIIDQMYRDLRDSFIDRSLSRDETFEVNTLNDINDQVVVISGRAGMGKSALLTHLSLKTKIAGPLPWIVRVNLPNYEKELSRWQEQEITINIPLVLSFLCNIALKNIDNHMKIELCHHEGKLSISHVESDIDSIALFELELFLYLYNNDAVVFLFDDFNAMCPHYEKEVIKIFTLLRDDGKRLWIMTCSYRHTRLALEKEFGTPYKLNPFVTEEKKIFLDRFFRTNLRLEKLNYDQFENVRSFMKFMSKFTNARLVSDPDREILPLFSLAVHLVYVLAVKFFQSEINRATASTIRAKVREKFDIDLDQYSAVDEILGRSPDEELELAGTPLHLYIAANYFKFQIEDSLSILLGPQEAKNKWDLIVNTFNLYRHYAEAHMKRIFCKEDPDDMSVVSTFQRTRREFLEKHKKLGLFTICRENDIAKLLKPDEIRDVQTMIAKIESGVDRSSLVTCVVDEVPRFAHLVFAEYFAVECLTDMMKLSVQDNPQNPLKNAPLWQAILHILLFNAPAGVRKAFDYKLQSDGDLATLTNSKECRNVVFQLLLKQDSTVTGVKDEGAENDTPVINALEDGLINIVNLFLSSAQLNLNRGNFDELLRLLKRSGKKFAEFGQEYTDTVKSVLDSVKETDVSKLMDILKSGQLTEVPMRHASSYCTSEVPDLQRHVEATATQLPLLTQKLEQLFHQRDTIGQTVTSLAELGVKVFMNDMLNKLKPPDPDLD